MLWASCWVNHCQNRLLEVQSWLSYLRMLGTLWIQSAYRFQCNPIFFSNWEHNRLSLRVCEKDSKVSYTTKCFYNQEADCNTLFSVSKVMKCRFHGWQHFRYCNLLGGRKVYIKAAYSGRMWAEMYNYTTFLRSDFCLLCSK